MQSAERKWMIKSENRILGPYSFDQLEDLLKKKQISLIDEVRDMDSRWMYIREAEALKPIVELIRKDIAASDDHTKTFQTRTAQSGALLTTTKDNPESKKFELPSFTNVSIEDVDFTETPTAKKSAAKNPPPFADKSVQQYVSETDPNVKSQLREKSKLTLLVLISVLMAIIVAGGGFYFYKISAQKKQEQRSLAAIRKYNLYGLDAKIIEVFGGLTPELQRQIIPDIIPMIPSLDAAGLLNGNQTISQLKQNPNVIDAKKALLDIVEFNQSLQDQDVKKARESLIRAKDLDPASDLIKEDDAILAYYESKFDQAAKIFHELFKVNPKGRILFGYAVSVIAKSSPDVSEDNSLISEIDRYTTTKVDFKKELLLINMFLNKRNNKETGFLYSFNEFVSTPIGLRQKFQIPPSVFNGLYSMYTIRDVFEKFKSGLTASQKLIIETHLKVELGEISAAQSLFSNYQSVLEKPEDKVNLSLQLDFALKNYSAVMAAEKTIDASKLNAASQLVLLQAKKKNSVPDSELATHVNFLKPEKNLVSMWAELMTIQDPLKRSIFVQMNANSGDDFIPFQEVRGAE